MKLTIETKSGQTYKLKGEELVEGFRNWLRDPEEEDPMLDWAVGRLNDYLSTYEELPEATQDWKKLGYVCEQHPEETFEHEFEGEICIGPGMPKPESV